MGELARQRRARDLWISRGHLWALGFGIVAATSASFFVGLALARSGPSATSAPRSATAPMSDESLVELLARVDSSADANSGVNTLSFPDALSGISPKVAMPVAVEPDLQVSAVLPGAVGNRPTDLMIALEDGSQAGLLADALRGRGWTVHVRTEGAEIQDGSAQLILTGGADLQMARESRERLVRELSELNRQSPVTLVPR